jgi:hypothetical protein
MEQPLIKLHLLFQVKLCTSYLPKLWVLLYYHKITSYNQFLYVTKLVMHQYFVCYQAGNGIVILSGERSFSFQICECSAIWNKNLKENHTTPGQILGITGTFTKTRYRRSTLRDAPSVPPFRYYNAPSILSLRLTISLNIKIWVICYKIYISLNRISTFLWHLTRISVQLDGQSSTQNMGWHSNTDEGTTSLQTCPKLFLI